MRFIKLNSLKNNKNKNWLTFVYCYFIDIIMIKDLFKIKTKFIIGNIYFYEMNIYFENNELRLI